MIRRTPFWLLAFALTAAALFTWPRTAFAASNDKDILELVQSVLDVEYLNTKFDDAIIKLELAKQACQGDGCSPKVRAKVFIALGTVLAGGKKNVKDAEAAFVEALREDPRAKLFGDYITSEVQTAFSRAQKRASASGGSSQVKADAPAKTKRVFKGGRAPRGWRSAEAHFFFVEAVNAEGAREWVECAGNAQASLALENRAQTRFLAASCQEKAGLWIEALADYEIVADTAGSPKVGLFDTARQARARAEQLSAKIPKIILRKPAKATDLVVLLNDVEVAPEKLGGEIWINPGQREVTATGKIDGASMVFEQVVEAGEFETVTVDIKLRPKGLVQADQAVVKCMSEAKTREDFAKCVGGGSITSGLNLHFGSEISGYHDSDHVDVITPAFYASVENPTTGWGVGASFIVDVVTAASTDIVATASPRWTEVRYVPALTGHKKFGDFDVGLKGNLSHEPDYLATSVGASVSGDFVQKTVTPSVSYEFSHDTSGVAGTRFDVFSKPITRHGLDLAVTFVLDKATFVGASATAVFEDGDGSKPYRYVPMFAPDIATRVLPGQTIESVNAFRNSERVIEQLPTDRQRYAVAGRVARRFTSSTLRAEERIYSDSWGLIASTTDASYLIDLTRDLRVWPHLRFHAQSGADFWQLAYVSTMTPAGGSIPALRTGDRELGPLWNLTFGGGTRFAFGEKKNWGLTVQGDVVYSRFLDHLFILQRFAYFGATTLDVDFE